MESGWMAVEVDGSFQWDYFVFTRLMIPANWIDSWNELHSAASAKIETESVSMQLGLVKAIWIINDRRIIEAYKPKRSVSPRRINNESLIG